LSSLDPARLGGTDQQPQPLIGFRTNEEWNNLVAQAGTLIAALDQIEDETNRKAIFDALASIDAIHREALHRLVRLFKEGVLEKVVTDPAIKTLMSMYDLMPQAEPNCRKVWDFLRQETEAGGGIIASSAGALPHWSPAPDEVVPREGEALLCAMDEGVFILASVGKQLFAFTGSCGVHQAPMFEGRLEGLSWICPHGPGCVYDIRNGARLGGGPTLDCRPVRIDDNGRILIGFGLPFSPKLAAF
jgi:hypothetical protein